MIAVFGRKAPPPPSPFAVPVSAEMLSGGSDCAPELVAMVVDFVNHLYDAGLYRSEEIPSHLVQLYHADFYIAQVENGGHSQFVHNCGRRLGTIMTNAQAGLSAMGANALADLMAELVRWNDRNPAEAASQTGFTGGRAKELDRMDRRHREILAADPVSKHAAAWICSWPGTRFVAPDMLRAAWDEQAHANSSRARRLAKARIEAFSERLADPVFVAIAIAADDADETLLDCLNNEVIDLSGRHENVQIVQTSYGLRGALCDADGVRLYALHVGGSGVTWTAVALIGHAESADIRHITSFIEGEPVAVAVDLLLSRARPSATIATIQPASPAAAIPGPLFRIMVGGEIMMMTKTKAGYVLAGQKPGETYPPVSFAEIAAHARSLDGI